MFLSIWFLPINTFARRNCSIIRDITGSYILRQLTSRYDWDETGERKRENRWNGGRHTTLFSGMRNGDWCVNWDLGERITSKYKQQFEHYVLTDGLKIKKKRKKYTFMSLLLSFIVTEAQTNNFLILKAPLIMILKQWECFQLSCIWHLTFVPGFSFSSFNWIICTVVNSKYLILL